MPISLKNLIGPGQSIEIGECVMLSDQPEPIIEIDDMVFLKSGNLLTDEEAEYPEAFERFGTLQNSGKDWIPLAGNVVARSGTIENNKWVIVGSQFVRSSNNGIDWEAHHELVGLPGIEVDHRCVAYNDGTWVVMGGSSGYTPYLMKSNDLENWELVDIDLDGITGENSGYGLGYVNGLWLCRFGTSNSSYRSSDLINWEKVNDIQVGSLTGNNIFCYEGMFITFTGHSVRTSTDGINWVSHVISFGARAIHYHNGLYVAVGGSGNSSRVMAGESLDSLVLVESGLVMTLNSVTNIGNLWVSVGNGGGVIISKDGYDWEKVDIGVSYSHTTVLGRENTGVMGGYTRPLQISLPTPTLGLPTLHQDDQSTQYMRIK